MKLIVGLGNPGRGYANNRHNAGFMCLTLLARSLAVKFDKRECKARTGKGELAGNSLLLARPQTYMNLSGESVKQLMAKYKIGIDDLLVIHDDLDLPLGKIRIRLGSGSGGHKGVRSIIAFLGTQDFLRLRIGIGKPESEPDLEVCEDDIVDFVLQDFTAAEKQVIDESLARASEAILCLLREGTTVAMNRYN